MGTRRIGNFKYYGVGIPAGVVIETSCDSDFTPRLIDFRTLTPADGTPIVPEAFAKLTVTGAAQMILTIEEGFNMIRCIQGAKTLSLPMQMLGADLQAHKVIYNNNPILIWCLTNTGIQTDRNGNIEPIRAC